jgi:ribosomal protein S18 acetylase RimI-like enzyme
MRDVPYSHTDIEIAEMQSLLTKSYNVSLRPFNWRSAVFENWIYASRYLEPIEYFTKRVRLWRTDTGELTACTIRGTNFTNVQVSYDYRFFEKEIFSWAEENTLERKPVNTMVYDWDVERQALLAERGYRNEGAIEDVRIYDLTQNHPQAVLPPGYRITSLKDYGSSAALIDLVNSVWGVTLDEAWFCGKSSAPGYSLDRKLLVVSPEGQLAAYSLFWLYPANKTAEIDPIGTHPNHRNRGLARALVLESFRRMRESGMEYAYIASETQDPVVSHLYASLHPVEVYQGCKWTKEIMTGS